MLGDRNHRIPDNPLKYLLFYGVFRDFVRGFEGVIEELVADVVFLGAVVQALVKRIHAARSILGVLMARSQQNGLKALFRPVMVLVRSV
ncbi:hypothetical protein ABB02_01654 [Clostridiaceae bacterium JG1575]|nr:hypothetical protein ABB02_01654 [Clostridiaceae bacterium JG1575]